MLDLDNKQRNNLWTTLLESLEGYLDQTESYRVSPVLDLQQIQNYIKQLPLESGVDPSLALEHVITGMERFTVHTPHPSYYGLFNPRANFPSILADTITATFNPQMAAWSHSPFCSEVENHLVRQLAHKFGYGEADGVFASGGAEANQTAVLCALNHHFPSYLQSGARGLQNDPVIYCSSEAHHSVLKAARCCGLGAHALREIIVDNSLQMSPEALEKAIDEDLKQGKAPFLVVATAGTTGTGNIDPLNHIADIVDNYGLWLHVDAAYGGALIISDEHRQHLSGIERSHSITFDIHKWLSVPMGCSVFITSDPQILDFTFSTKNEYMPKDAAGMSVKDPFTHSIQWSRRFIGLKLYLSLLTFGWKGFEAMIHHTLDMGDYLRARVQEKGWQIHNQSKLPVVCFTVPSTSNTFDISQRVVASGQAWISVYPIRGESTLRACITNYATQTSHLDKLIALIASQVS